MYEFKKTQLNAVHKFIMYGWNYQSSEHYWKDIHGETHCECLPDFLFECPWHCNLDHMIDKWSAAYDKCPYMPLVALYAELDGTNRKNLIAWICENYSETLIKD